MKVCIITVYDSVNCGSYLQALILGKKCNQLGYDVYYLKREYKYKLHLKINHLKKAIKLLIKSGYCSYKSKRMLDREFRKKQHEFKVIGKKQLQNMDCIIVGSDTLWNINSSYFKNNYKLFFGGDFMNVKAITYAISAANAKLDSILKLPNIKKYINNFYKLSVRDEATKTIAENLYEKKVHIVCDPTLLFEKKDYIELVGPKRESKKYIYLYLFEDLDAKQIQNIKLFAKNNDLKIIDGTQNKKWADKLLPNTPDIFLNYMYYADYIITDTFHGTIFSINFQKQFVSIDRKKNKVNEILLRYGINNHLVQSDNLSEKLIELINYKEINQKISKIRKESIELLESIKN